jgi:hypothetical protein
LGERLAETGPGSVLSRAVDRRRVIASGEHRPVADCDPARCEPAPVLVDPVPVLRRDVGHGAGRWSPRRFPEGRDLCFGPFRLVGGHVDVGLEERGLVPIELQEPGNPRRSSRVPGPLTCTPCLVVDRIDNVLVAARGVGVPHLPRMPEIVLYFG